MYKFSAPMPYTTEDIDKLLSINKEIEKSKITNLFGALPYSCELFTGFEQYRNVSLNNVSWDYWKRLISYCLEADIDFVYLFNSCSRMPIESPDCKIMLEKLDKLLAELSSIGVTKLRLAEHKLIKYIVNNYSKFDIYASTSFEFKSISEYQNFMFMHPYIKQIVPSHDLIKNFTFLKNLKNLLPDVDIEILTNEGCLTGCPCRNGHASEHFGKLVMLNDDINLSNLFYTSVFCRNLHQIHPIYSFIKSNIIYPWEINEYSKIGINKFKFSGRDIYHFGFDSCLKIYGSYLKCIENFKEYKDLPINEFIYHHNSSASLRLLKTKEIRHLLPKIAHFKKYGHLCASKCGVECRYCYRCAEKIQKVFLKKQKEQELKSTPFCKK